LKIYGALKTRFELGMKLNHKRRMCRNDVRNFTTAYLTRSSGG